MSGATELLAEGRRQEAAGQSRSAIDIYQKAILAAPYEPAGYIHLSELLYVGGFVSEARGILDVGLRQLPASPLLNWSRLMVGLPMVAASRAEIDDAVNGYRRGLRELRSVCFANEAALTEAARAVGLRSPFFLPYLGVDDRALSTMFGRLATDIMAANLPAHATPVVTPWDRREKIRVGVVSGLFLRHAVWRLPTRGWIAQLDRSRFHLTGYHTRDQRDVETDRAAALFDRFHSGWAPLATWLTRIRADAPHVLIYPELGADQTSFQLACLPLAPVRCTSWGQPVTSGLPTITHYLSSDAMEPADAAGHYTETLVRLAGLGCVLDRDAASWGEAPHAGDAWAGFGFPPDTVRVLCCQATQKYLPEFDTLFPRIAQAVPNARFVFIAQTERARDIFWRRLYLAFHAAGLPAERFCLFVPALPHAAFSALVRDAHINLDSIGWSGCNTTIDALGHAVPTVTLPGTTMRARHGLALLRRAGVPELVVESEDAMVVMVTRLATDPAYAASIRDRLRAGAEGLFGDTTPVRDLETFLTEAVRSASPNL
jgi:predicted O-linked N-acetylglucosamine transferase (SPINDLY family)